MLTSRQSSGGVTFNRMLFSRGLSFGSTFKNKEKNNYYMGVHSTSFNSGVYLPV